MSAPDPKASPGYETSDVHFGTLVILLISTILLVAVSMYISIWMDKAFSRFSPMHDQPESPMAKLHQLPPLPRLQPNPGIDMIRMRETTSEELGTYGWVNKPSGQVHIPIEEAMAKIAAEGLPTAKDKDAR